jgi:hypothetical protein
MMNIHCRPRLCENPKSEISSGEPLGSEPLGSESSARVDQLEPLGSESSARVDQLLMTAVGRFRQFKVSKFSVIE